MQYVSYRMLRQNGVMWWACAYDPNIPEAEEELP